MTEHLLKFAALFFGGGGVGVGGLYCIVTLQSQPNHMQKKKKMRSGMRPTYYRQCGPSLFNSCIGSEWFVAKGHTPHTTEAHTNRTTCRLVGQNSHAPSNVFGRIKSWSTVARPGRNLNCSSCI